MTQERALQFGEGGVGEGLLFVITLLIDDMRGVCVLTLRTGFFEAWEGILVHVYAYAYARWGFEWGSLRLLLLRGSG
jgi:hypothetical protein